MTTRPISSLVARAPFATLFPMSDVVLAAITESMRQQGFDPAEPLELWGDVVVDGHTRLKAAAQAGVQAVEVCAKDFADERAALEYAIRRQRDRRNLTPNEMGGYVTRALMAYEQRGAGRPATVQDCTVAPKSAAAMADMLGVSERTVKAARTVLEHADEPTKRAVLDGQKSINEAYTETQTQRRYAPEPAAAPAPRPSLQPSFYTVPTWQALTPSARMDAIAAGLDGKASGFNKQENDRIEWALWSWNPVTGCDHGCAYCYARVIANRFYTFVPESERFAPMLYPSRLNAPRHVKVPVAAAHNIGEQNVFVCSMADLFGKWVPQEWIDAVFAEVVAAPQWNFLFLTKFPQRLAEQDWPANAWVGTSVDTQARVANAQRSFSSVKAGVKWLSCEPLLEPLHFDSLEMFDWIVIGGQTAQQPQNPEFVPPWEWIEDLIEQARRANCRVYLKAEPDMRPREYPGAVVQVAVPA
jgi:protein gp37/ParB-like chromosome segregation protein Spo0J